MPIIFVDESEYLSGKVKLPTTGYIRVEDFSCTYCCSNFRAMIKIGDNYAIWNMTQPIKDFGMLAVGGRTLDIEIYIQITEDDSIKYINISELDYDCPLLLTIGTYENRCTDLPHLDSKN